MAKKITTRVHKKRIAPEGQIWLVVKDGKREVACLCMEMEEDRKELLFDKMIERLYYES